MAGCTGNSNPSTTGPLDRCAEPVALTAERSTVPTLGATRLVVEGGSEERSFAFVDNQSGGLVSQTGEYVAGATPGVTDLLEVVDEGCENRAQVSVQVVSSMDPVPRVAEVPPGTSFTITNAGGSGALECVGDLRSGGQLDGCTWTAGDLADVDDIEVSDPGTGEQLTLRYTVDPDARLRLVGESLYLPVGHPFEIAFAGGTGQVTASTSDPALELDENVLTATRPGSYTVHARDDIVADLEVTVTVEAVAPLTAPIDRDGLGLDSASIATGDFNGDGHEDAVVGVVDASVGAFGSGAVYVYAGTVDGLEDEPLAVLTVEQGTAGAGRSVAVGDLDGNGLIDLAVGIDAYDADGETDQGRVEIYQGLVDGFFDDEPTWTVMGGSPFDHVGYGVAMCDVDGDGVVDLATSGFGIEEPGAMRPNEGGIYLWLGGKAGVSGPPDRAMYSGRANFGMGRTLAAGDIDDDGLCDLASASLTRAEDGAGQDGIVWLFTGDTLVGAGPYDPDRTYAIDTDDDVALFGRGITFGSLDADDVDDLVVGAFRDDGDGLDRGAVYVFGSGQFDAQSSTEPVWASQATAVLRGTNDGDLLGQGLAVADGDLWVGAPGAARVYRVEGPALVGDVTVAVATEDWAGPQGGFGAAVGVGVTHAVRDDTYGVQLGAPWSLDSAGPRRLEMPSDASGGGLGAAGSFSWFDHDGNGVFDLMAGTRGAPSATAIDVGAVQQWSGFAGRWGLEPDRVLTAGGARSDRFGARVRSAGDFDGNGVEDLLVVADGADKPEGFDSSAVINPNDCPGAADNTGAVYVYRGGTSAPAFVIYGTSVGADIDRVTAGFDHDGDGQDDLVFASADSGPAGAFTLIPGRTSYSNGTYVICEGTTWSGVAAGSRLGAAVAPVGDIDGDGCDELAIGADGDDLGLTDQGSVRVLFGWGPRCPGHREPEVATVVSGMQGSRFGSALAGGQDVDGDGLPDLAVAGVTSAGDGSVWWLSGAWLAGLERDAAVTFPSDETQRSRVPDTSRFDGPEAGSGFGRSLTMVSHPTQSARIAVGEPLGAVGGTVGAGGVWMLAPDAGARLQVVGLVGGTGLTPGNGLGDALAGDPRVPLLAVGVPGADLAGVDSGAIYPFTLR